MKVLIVNETKLMSSFMEQILSRYTTDIHLLNYDVDVICQFINQTNIDLFIIYESPDCLKTRDILEQVFERCSEFASMPLSSVLIRNLSSFEDDSYRFFREFMIEGRLVPMLFSNLSENLTNFIENNYLDKTPIFEQSTLLRGDFLVLVIDDSPVSRKLISEALRKKRFDVVEAEDGLSGLEIYKQGKVKLIISDIEMPRMSGVELCQKIRAIDEYIELLIVSSISHHETVDMVYQIGASDFYLKPLDVSKIVTKVELIFENWVEKCKHKILIVDDDRFVSEKLKQEFLKNGMPVVTASNGVEAISKAIIEKPSIIVSDVEMPLINGYDFLEAIKDYGPLEQSTRIMMSGSFNIQKSRSATNDITLQFYPKPFEPKQLILQCEQIISSKMLHLRRENNLFFSTVKSLITALEERDEYTRGHSERVTQYAILIGKHMNMSRHQIKLLELSASLHDIGKIGVKDSILMKPGSLLDEEFEIIKQHPDLGSKIIEPIASLKRVAKIVQAHHERIDGKGYPQGLKDTEIPIESKIIAIADTYDAMTSKRPYRVPLSDECARAELLKVSGTQLDGACVMAFIAVLERLHANR